MAGNRMGECCICLGDFNQPKILTCYHSFCCTCLEDYVKQFAVNNKFPCPLCRSEVKVPPGGVHKFTNNFYVPDRAYETRHPTTKASGNDADTGDTGDKQLTDKTQQDDTLWCDVCKHLSASFNCLACDKLIGMKCRDTHDVFLEGHADLVFHLDGTPAEHYDTDLLVVNLPEKDDAVNSQGNVSPERRLPSVTNRKDYCTTEHRSYKPAEILCKTCSVVLCLSCFTLKHYTHEISYIINSHRVSYKQRHLQRQLQLQFLEDQIEKCTNHKKNLDLTISYLNEKRSELCSQMDDQSHETTTKQKQIQRLADDFKSKTNRWKDVKTKGYHIG